MERSIPVGTILEQRFKNNNIFTAFPIIPKTCFVSLPPHRNCPQRVNTQPILFQNSMWPSPRVGGDSDVNTLQSSLCVASGKKNCPDNFKKYQKPHSYHVPATRTVRKEWILNRFFFRIACGLALEQAMTLMWELYIQVYVWPVEKNIFPDNFKKYQKPHSYHVPATRTVRIEWILNRFFFRIACGLALEKAVTAMWNII